MRMDEWELDPDFDWVSTDTTASALNGSAKLRVPLAGIAPPAKLGLDSNGGYVQ